jgi:hypothetical protein
MNMNDVFNFPRDNTNLDYEDKESINFFENKHKYKNNFFRINL